MGVELTYHCSNSLLVYLNHCIVYLVVDHLILLSWLIVIAT